MEILESIARSVQIVARNPAAILCTLGGLGWLFHVQGAGVLLFLGIGVHILWLRR